MKASTFFTTDHAERYLGTLCKHFGHKVPVNYSQRSGRIELPCGLCDLYAAATGLGLTALAGDRTQLDRTIQVISSHLDRFAFRENPNLTWVTKDTEARHLHTITPLNKSPMTKTAKSRSVTSRE